MHEELCFPEELPQPHLAGAGTHTTSPWRGRLVERHFEHLSSTVKRCQLYSSTNSQHQIPLDTRAPKHFAKTTPCLCLMTPVYWATSSQVRMETYYRLLRTVRLFAISFTFLLHSWCPNFSFSFTLMSQFTILTKTVKIWLASCLLIQTYMMAPPLPI